MHSLLLSGLSKKNNKLKTNRFLMPGLFIIASCLLFFNQGLFFHKKSIVGDAADALFPSLWYTGHLWRSGIIPLWNSFLFNGYPIFSDPQNQTFYPFNIIISFITDFSAKIVYLQLVFHYVLAGIFMYLFAGFYVKNNAGRLIAAMTYMFNGFMINHFHHLTVIDTVAWLPLILFFLEKGWREHNLLYFVPAGISTALMILAGHPQSMLYIYYMILFFTLFKCFWPITGKGISFFPLGLTVASLVFSMLLASIQLIPSYEFSTFSNRSGPLPYESIVNSGQLYLPHLITLILPDFLGAVRGPYIGFTDITHSSIYCGILFLAIFPYIFAKRNKEVYFYIFMFSTTLLIAMGDSGYIFRFLYHYMPGFDLFRSPVQYRFGLGFSAAILTGIALENITNRTTTNRFVKHVYFTVVFILLVTTVILTMHSPQYEKVLDNIFNNAIFFILALSVCIFVLHLLEKQKISITIFNSVLILLVFIDFYSNGANALSFGAQRNHKALDYDASSVALVIKGKNQLKQNMHTPFLSDEEITKGLVRIYVDDNVDYSKGFSYVPYDYQKLAVLGYNRSILYRIFMTDGYNPMMLQRYVLFNRILKQRSYKKFLMLSNVKYIFKTDGTFEVLPDDEILSRAYIVTKAEYVENPNLILDRLSAPFFDVKDKAVVEEPIDIKSEDACKGTTEAHIIQYLPNKIGLITESACSSLLVLSETHYPGWQVQIDSSIIKDALKVNYCFMGTVIPAGKHHVVFEFVPTSFKIGLFVSVSALLGGLIFGMAKLKNRSKRTRV